MQYKYLENNVDSDNVIKDVIFERLPDGWEVIDSQNLWVMFTPKGLELPEQGWKGHISALYWNSEEIAIKASSYFFEKNIPFKVIDSISKLKIINDFHYPLSGANKFITFYSMSEEKFCEEMVELYEILKEYKGPRIYTDFQVGRFGVLHYRYGAYKEVKIFSPEKNDFIYCIKNLEGNYVEDKRIPGYYKPEFICNPFEKEDTIFFMTEKMSMDEKQKINRYHFLKLLQRGNKGNVYLAKNAKNEEVIVKEANPYIAITENVEAKDLLSREIELLRSLVNEPYIARYFDSFECQGKLFLVEEKISGESMTSLAQKKNLEDGERLAIYIKLESIIKRLHHLGYVLYDLKPDNIIVKGNDVFIIDLESMEKKGMNQLLYTPGFLLSKHNDERNDFFAGLVCMFAMELGTIPILKYEEENEEIVKKRVFGYLYVLTKRKQNEKVVEFIREYICRNLQWEEELFNLKIEGVRKVLKKNQEQIIKYVKLNKIMKWERAPFGTNLNKFGLQHGVAGVLGTLYNETKDERIKRTIENFMSKKESISEIRSILDPSFLFGKSGIACFLADLYVGSKNIEFIKCIDEILLNTGFDENNVIREENVEDFSLGRAGYIYALIYVWIRTGLERYWIMGLEEGQRLLKNLKLTVREIANCEELGFAHGEAGVYYVIFLIGLISRNDEYLESVRIAVRKQLCFYKEYLDNNRRVNISWCKGLSGFADYLVRINVYFKDNEITQFVERTVEILEKEMFKESNCICHGNGSSVNFLIDAYIRTGKTSYRDAAKRIGEYMRLSFIDNTKGENKIPDETKVNTSEDYGVGRAGVIYALNRIFRNNENLFMINEERLMKNE